MFLIEYNALQDCAYFNCFPVMVSDFRTTLAVLLECQIQNQSKQDLILKFLECFSIRQNKKNYLFAFNLLFVLIVVSLTQSPFLFPMTFLTGIAFTLFVMKMQILYGNNHGNLQINKCRYCLGSSLNLYCISIKQ